jgi:uncharacterized SAM-binding protein YcdF (DUF218 family)
MALLTDLGFKTKIAIASATLVFLVFFIGFLQFNNRIPKQQPTNIATADAIVVLTGGKSRVIEALKLLSAGKGSRLLISGVHKSTSRAALARLVPIQGKLLDCCVDLDKAARNTQGNAAETAVWARKNKFKSLIVVTSGYHMQRSLIELQNVLPQVTLIAYPVVVETVPVTRWWTNFDTAQLLALEYVKYLTALIRLRF